MHLNLHSLHHTLSLPKYKELIEMYICIAIRTFAFSLVGVFIPIYFMSELGFDLKKVLIYFLLWAILTIAVIVPISKLITLIGSKKAMLISSPLSALYILLLHLMKTYPMHYFWIALVSALSMQLFWMGFHLDFAKNSHKKKRGEEASIWFSIFLAVGVLGPILGGGVITFFSFKILFLISAALLLLANVPLLFSKEPELNNDFSPSAIFKKEHMRDFAMYALYGMRELADAIFWPLLIFLIMKEVLSLGTIVSIAYVITAIASLGIGRFADHGKTTKVTRAAMIIDSVSWPARMLAKTFAPILSMTVLSFLTFALMDVTSHKKFYDSMKGSIEYVTMREIAMATGRVIITLAVLLLGFKGGFIATGIGSAIYAIL